MSWLSLVFILGYYGKLNSSIEQKEDTRNFVSWKTQEIFHFDNENGGYFKWVNSICEACSYKIMFPYAYSDSELEKK